ncbi:hypothetical protein V2J09_010060 [Rumex salicifolius]
MKRSKYEDKAMGPMFPRLHVNDTERGGPRAPPRNKMALYEQLTIPSNRYGQGNMHLNPNSGASQGTSNERIVYFPSYQHPVSRPLPAHSPDRLQRQSSDAVNLRSLGLQADQRRNPEDEDDFAVPIFSQPGKQLYKNAHQSRNDEGRCRTFSSSCSFRYPNACNIETDQADSASLSLRQVREDQDDEQTTTIIVSSSDPPTIKYSADVSARESSGGAMQLQEDALMDDHLDMNRTNRLEYTNNSRYSDSCGPIKEAKGRISSRLKSNSPFRPSNRNEIDCEDEGNQRDNSLREHMDRANDVSRTSNVANLSDIDVSPDSVVDVIGLKHFWKARRAIVNQQRVFAVQVFELHRLIKVQQLIAESPEVLIDARAFLGKSTIKVTPIKHIPSQYTLKALADSNKPKDNPPKPNPKDDYTEATSESAVAKPPVSASPPKPTQPNLIHHPQFPANPALQIPPPMAIPQPGGHQWLVPVMSPSEGLIYKPYPGPAFPSPLCGGCGPHGTTPPPLPAHPFINPNYGVQPSPYYHHPGYFPPYGMSVINSAVSGSAVDQINHRSGSNPNGETGQTVIRMRNFSVQQQGSCNKLSQRHSELLGSTASSPSERAQDIVRPVVARKEKDAFALFPTRATPPQTRETEQQPTTLVKAVPHNPRTTPQPYETEQPNTLVKAVPHIVRTMSQPRETEQQATTLVKVVPHNARTATESAARIFRSIQEERRQNQPN